MNIETFSIVVPAIIVAICIWIAWLFWAALSTRAGSGSRVFAESMLATSLPLALILLALKGTDAHFDKRRNKMGDAE